MGVIGIPFVFPGVPHVKAFFQTPCCHRDVLDRYPDDLGVQDGVSFGRYEARQKILKHIKEGFLIEVIQVHGDKILFNPKVTFTKNSTAIDKDVLKEADGISIKQKGIALLIKTADCQPIFFVDKKGEYIAGLHVGWRGNRIGFLAKAVEGFCSQYKLEPKDLLVVRGPSLSRGYARFTNFSEEWGNAFESWFCKQSQTMDLWRLTFDQLVGAGVYKENIFSLDLCTYSLPELFFSYRRDRFCGRQGSLIWIES